MACRVAVATRTPGNCLRSYSTMTARLAGDSRRHPPLAQTSVLAQATRTHGRKTRGVNRCANFRLRGELGMLARVRHAACHRCGLAPTSVSSIAPTCDSPIAPTRVSRLAPTRVRGTLRVIIGDHAYAE